MSVHFNFKLLIRLTYRSLFASRGTNAQLTPKRVAVLILCVLIYPVSEIINWLCLWLDNLFFPGYRKENVRAPVFILGAARSGTTLLHRLLSSDTRQFTTMTLTEMLFAPSVIQKKICSAVSSLDKRAGSPVSNGLRALDRKLFSHVSAVHKLSFFEPEEDDFVLLHIFSSAFLMYVFPFEEEFRSLLFFDDQLPQKQRRAIMTFYRQCIQRHLYVFGKGRHYLAKGPYLNSKIQSINESFPDAKIIFLLRTPIKVLPSTLSLIREGCKQFMSPLEPYPMRELILQLVAYWYRRPLDHLRQLPDKRQMLLQYDILLQHLEHTVVQIYKHFELDITPRFRRMLQQKSKEACSYTSSHKYSLEQVGLSREQIMIEYQDVLRQLSNQ